MPTESLHDFSARRLEGKEEESFSEYAGQLVLLANTASFCFTTPQYEALEKLYQTYREQGLVVLAFPSRDFLWEEHKSEAKIQDVCDRYKLSFPVYAPIHVRGRKKHPLFAYLGDKQRNGLTNAAPTWNFAKYLIDSQGHLIDHWPPPTSPTDPNICRAIEAHLPHPQPAEST